MQHFFGLTVGVDFDVYTTPLSEIKAQFRPLARSFSLNSLYPIKLKSNIHKYIEDDKHDLLDAGFQILGQLD